MQELRLLGVDTDGEYVLLVSPGGNRYRLPVDDELREAVRRTPHDTSHSRPARERIAVSPREIQRRVRSGMSAEQIADEFDVPVEHIERYEGPVLAERAHVAGLAQRQQLRGDNGEQASLGDVVDDRLHMRSAENVEWDSWRLDTGSWLVQLTFRAGGKQRGARWEFHPSRAHLEALDDEARWFMHSDDTLDTPPTVAEVFGVANTMSARTGRDEPTPEPSFASTEELLHHLQTRRPHPQRAADEADLPPAAHPAASTITQTADLESPDQSESAEPRDPEQNDDASRPASTSGVTATHGGSPSVPSDAHMRPQRTSAGNSEAPRARQQSGAEVIDLVSAEQRISSEKRASSAKRVNAQKVTGSHTTANAVTAPATEEQHDQQSETESRNDTAKKPAAKGKTARSAATNDQPDDASESVSTKRTTEAPKAKPRRHKVPSWDEIMFGSKD